jgi:hypothetical protein
MDESKSAPEATKVAIECLTLWTESNRQEAAEHIAAVQSQDGPDHIIVGLLNLGMILLYQAARNAGAEDLRAAGAEILQDIASPGLSVRD